MARLAVRRKADALVIPPVRLGFVTVIAVEFLPVHQWNVRRKMSLMIKAQHVRVTNLLTIELEFRMPIPKGRKCLRVTASRPRQLEDHLLRRSGMSVERLRGKLHSFLC